MPSEHSQKYLRSWAEWATVSQGLGDPFAVGAPGIAGVHLGTLDHQNYVWGLGWPRVRGWHAPQKDLPEVVPEVPSDPTQQISRAVIGNPDLRMV